MEWATSLKVTGVPPFPEEPEELQAERDRAVRLPAIRRDKKRFAVKTYIMDSSLHMRSYCYCIIDFLLWCGVSGKCQQTAALVPVRAEGLLIAPYHFTVLTGSHALFSAEDLCKITEIRNAAHRRDLLNGLAGSI